ncbi:hypothetical protein [Xanthomonas phaseoli]|uniref:hypothetical protein n=1 Tax=Xanthomonas phaseoli TaxID=1985254 RepID=UPI0002F9740E|nr:hypothetical protein [Xanthomonas phaseoli]
MSADRQHTYEQVVEYEAAREILNGHVAMRSASLADEMAKPAPDAGAIVRLQGEIASLALEMDTLDLHDAAAVALVIQRRGAELHELRRTRFAHAHAA